MTFTTALKRSMLWLLLAASTAVLPTLALADPPASESSATKPVCRLKAAGVVPAGLELTAAMLGDESARLEKSAALDADAKAKARGCYEQAAEQVKIAESALAKAKALQKDIEDAPAQLAEVQAKLALPASDAAPDVPTDTSLAQLEQMVLQAQLESSAARRAFTDLDEQPKARSDRRAEIPHLQMALRQQLDEISGQLAQPAGGDEPAELAAARKRLLQARKQAVERQMQALQLETISFDCTTDLLAGRRDLAQRASRAASRQYRALKKLADDRRKAQAQAELERARQIVAAAGGDNEILRQLAVENESLAAARTGADGLSAKLDEVNAQVDQANRAYFRLRGDFKTIQEKVSAVGLNESIGLLLRRQQASLPDIGRLRREMLLRKKTNSEAQLRWLEIRDQRHALDNMDARVNEILAKAGANLSSQQRESLTAAVRSLLESRRGYFDGLIDDYSAYAARLIDLDAANQRLLAQAEQFSQYINEHVLWIPSDRPVSELKPAAVTDSLAWLFSAPAWRAAGREMWQSAAAAPTASLGLMLVGVCGVLVRRRPIWAVATKSNTLHRRRWAFAGRILATILPAAAPAAILWALATALSDADQAAEFCQSLAAGLRGLAVGVLAIGLLVRALRHDSLAGYLHWPAAACDLLRRRLLGLAAAGLPVLALVLVLDGQFESRHGGLGRLLFMAGMLLLCSFVQWSLRPTGAIAAPLLHRAGGWAHRLRNVCFGLLLLAPLGLAIAAGMGYYYSATQLASCLLLSTVLLVGLLMLGSFFRRLVQSAQLKAPVEDIHPDPIDGFAKDAKGQAGEKLVPAAQTSVQVQVRQKNARHQVRQLLSFFMLAALVVGLWLIWASVIPALEACGRVPLWTKSAVSTIVNAADPSAAPQTVERLAAVTLADLLQSLLALVLTVVAAKNIPGLMHIALARKMVTPYYFSGINPDKSAKNSMVSPFFALIAVTRYVIIVAGAITTFGLIGISWSNIQWLVAAVTVGLGFGLQEIFANFVSGLILLFERPIRPGDVVTIGSVTGVVSRIRTRATTILDFDNKELVVPNKAFITGQLVNWTLSNTVLRLVVPVSVAWGSDKQRAQSLLLEQARTNPLVLQAPPPKVHLVGFGPACLRFELQVFVPDLESYEKAQHDLHLAIEQAFRQNAINIV